MVKACGDHPGETVQEIDTFEQPTNGTVSGFYDDEVLDPEEPYVNPMGEWDGTTFSLCRFYAEPVNWEEIGVECFQTMGCITVVYRLDEEDSCVTEDDFDVEISTWQLRVTTADPLDASSKKRKEVDCLSGDLSGKIRPNFCSWSIVEQNFNKYLQIRMSKDDHREWKKLWYEGIPMSNPNRKGNFSWGANSKSKREQSKLQKLPPNTLFGVAEPLEINPCTLSVGLDDNQRYSDYVVVFIHFHRAELERLEQDIPLEELIGADIDERSLRVYVRSGGTPIVLFEGELENLCVPELTSWEFVRAKKGHPNGRGEAFNPALRIDIAKHPEAQTLWRKMFKSSRHAHQIQVDEEQAKEDAYQAAMKKLNSRYTKVCKVEEEEKAKPAPKQDELQDTPDNPTKEPTVTFDPALVPLKFKELRAEGMAPKEAMQKALEIVKEGAAAAAAAMKASKSKAHFQYV